ncbi:MAG: hypothetical protein U1A22_03130 [Xanthomonadaceae bacterium]|nr:hypothetical protein [Xanthomonadaceae bacterium]
MRLALIVSGAVQRVALRDGPYRGEYREWPSGEAVTLGDDAILALEPWAYRVLVQGD